jgi:hypothetical protein
VQTKGEALTKRPQTSQSNPVTSLPKQIGTHVLEAGKDFFFQRLCCFSLNVMLLIQVDDSN